MLKIGDPVRSCRSVADPCETTRKIVAAMDLVVFLPLLVILGAFMFFASRRQKKAMQATIDLHNSLEIGDRVHTTSGLQATITGVSDDTVDLEIAPGIVTTWMKLAVRDKIADTVDHDEVEEYTEDAAEPDTQEYGQGPDQLKRD
jgi:preprotein translocase subunit YajC